MKLSDQEQVILKAIGSGVAEVSRVIKAVGYPKATVKKVLVRLSEKGIVVLHRHDYPQSLTPDQRKMMVRIGRDYFNAVSVMKRNASARKLALPVEWQVRPTSWGGARWQHRQEAGDDVYDRTFPNASDLEWYLADRYGWKFARKVLATLKTSTGDPVGQRNPKSKSKTALKTTGRALKGLAKGALSAGAQILGAGAMALNPAKKKTAKRKRNRDYPYWNIYHVDTKKSPPYDKTFLGSSSFGMDKKEAIEKFRRSHYPGRLRAGTKIIAEKGIVTTKNPRSKRNKTVIRAGRIDHLDVSKVHNPRKRLKVRNKYIDLVIKGQAKKTPQGWKVGRKTFAQGRGTVSVSSGYYLDKHTGMVYAKRERNKAKKKRNVSEGFYDASGVFHPIRSSEDYSPSTAGETGRKAKRTRSKKKLASKRKASQTARRKRMVAGRKRTTSRLAGRAIKKSAGLLKKGKKRNNPSAESIRKEFAGSINGERDLFFPQGTPSGKLAKLGKLVSITTEAGTIKPVHGAAWLCADTKGKLHIGSVSGAPLFDGPARSFGHVTRIEYESTKPHLGYKGPIIWFHKAGEENGIKPTLRADGKGGLVFRGGDYRLTRRGIEN